MYFANVGWIVLDPTPGRAPAHNTQMAGLAQPQQFGFNDEATQDGNVLPPTTLPAPAPDGGGTGDLTLPDDLFNEPNPDQSTGAAGTDDGGRIDLGSVLRVALIAAGIAGVIALVPLLRWTLRRRRVARIAGDPVARTELAWDDATDALRLVGLDADPSETPAEFARRAIAQHRRVGPVDTLADAVTIVRYADLDDPLEPALTARRASDEIAETCRSQVTTARRWAELFDPRTLNQN